MVTGKPAIVGGTSAFSEEIPIARPPLSRYTTERFMGKLKEILDSGQITNGDSVSEFERRVASLLGVKHAVALSSCTSGLILTMQLLGLAGKEVLMPTFTFAATAHAAYWNKCRVVFVDSDPETFDISISDLKSRISPHTAGIIGVHVFGNPCEAEALAEVAREHKLRLVLDAAHGLGTSLRGRRIGGFGDAEVFSCSPTKIVTTLDGGIVSTNNPALARELGTARNYGVYPDYTCAVPGLSARMSEIGATLGQAMLSDIDEMVSNRNSYADRYRCGLKEVPGIRFQKTTPGGVHGYKDFAIVVEPGEFGIGRDLLAKALELEGIATKKYFSPLCHELKPFKRHARTGLASAESLSKNVLCLPMYSYMDMALINRICLAIMRIHKHADELRPAGNGWRAFPSVPLRTD